MKYLLELTSKALAILLVGWLLAIYIAPDKCSSVKRVALPISLFFDYIINPMVKNHVSDSTKLLLLRTQYDMTVWTMNVYEKTRYDTKKVRLEDGTIREVYECLN